ncbi:MAG: F0F1 ATP synthase subunit A [Chloroflexota bacterium]
MSRSFTQNVISSKAYNDLALTQTHSQVGNQDTAQVLEGEHKPEAAEENVFSKLVAENTGDHAAYSFFDAFHLELPKIFVDDGFHFYINKHSMEQAGLFTEAHHKVVRTSDRQAPALDLSVTSLVLFQWIAMIILFVAFFFTARKYKKRGETTAPTGLQNLMETLILYVKEEIVAPNLNSAKLTNSLFPYFVGLFFFILVMNLLGLVPGGHSPTSNLAVTGGLAIIAFIVINATSIMQNGIVNYLKHLLGGAPWWLFPIMVPIEIISMFVKPFALTVRLFANMTAGHIILLSLLGLIFFFKTVAVAPITTGFSLFIYALELLVCFIQAYVFTILTAVFVGLAAGDHGGHAASH